MPIRLWKLVGCNYITTKSLPYHMSLKQKLSQILDHLRFMSKAYQLAKYKLCNPGVTYLFESPEVRTSLVSYSPRIRILNRWLQYWLLSDKLKSFLTRLGYSTTFKNKRKENFKPVSESHWIWDCAKPASGLRTTLDFGSQNTSLLNPHHAESNTHNRCMMQGLESHITRASCLETEISCTI